MTDLNLIAISVGNTRTQAGLFTDDTLRESRRFDNDRRPDVVQCVLDWWRRIGDSPQAAVLIASVNDAVAGPVAAALKDQLGIDIYRVGEDVPVPIGRQLDPETITGPDRLLNAAAAYDRIRQACIVVDAGTALTVDFVDGEGTFHGGAIAPGAAAQLRALHQQAAALPELNFVKPDDEAFGRSTSQAMLTGVYHGIRGAVQRLVEQYAEAYGAFPQVVATGGDAETLFADEELIDNVVPDLTLLGIAVAARAALARRRADGSGGP